MARLTLPWALALALHALCARGIRADSVPFQLLTDWRLSPVMGVESTAPLLAWALPDGMAQQAGAHVTVTVAQSGATMWDSGWVSTGTQSMAYAGPRLAPATAYAWSVSVLGANATQPSGSSQPAQFVTGLWDSWSAVPLWHANASAAFVFLRTDVVLAQPVAALYAAYAFVTANPYISTAGEHENAKLLGAYRLYVNGAWIGVGPGRQGTCGPMCPIQNDPGACTCTPMHVYDTYNVTTAVQQGAGNVTLAIQAYNWAFGAAGTGLESKVQAQFRFVFTGGSVQDVATSPGSWLSFAADAFINVTCCTETDWYFGPRENYAAAQEPVGWRLPGFQPSSAWIPAVAAPNITAALTARPSVPVAITDPLPIPPVVMLGPGHYFLALDKEIQGGLRVHFSNASGDEVFLVRLGEELLTSGGAGGGCAAPPAVPAVRYDMRTGNSYWGAWSLRSGDQTLEHHEYLEFRYAEILTEAAATGNGQCVNSPIGDYTSTLTLSCSAPSAVITNVTFASYGTPSGCCGASQGSNTFAVNASCHAANSAAVLSALCLGKASCSFNLQQAFGGSDPCHDVFKWLDAAVQCSAPASSHASLPNVSVEVWQLTYPAAYVPNQVQTSDSVINAIWDLSQYTVVAAGGLDMYTDSNTRQRSVICAEAMSLNLLMQYATSVEYTLPNYTLTYMLNTRPTSLGWAEWPALAIMSTHHGWMYSGDLSTFAGHYAHLRNFTEITFVNASTGLWSCTGKEMDCNKPEIDWPAGMRDGFVFEPTNTVVNAYVYAAMLMFADMAEALGGHDADVTLFRNAAQALRAAINAQLFDAQAQQYVDGAGTTHSAWQTSVFALAFGVPEGNMSSVVWETVVNGAIGNLSTCGPGNVYPTSFALDAMYMNDSDHGFAGYALLTCNGTNGWQNMLRQGATTTMEAWTPDEKPNLTWSHSWGASPAHIVPRRFFGVMPTSSGFSTAIIKPQPGPVTSASAVVPSLRGPFFVSFNQTLAGRTTTAVNMTVGVPGSVNATACIPASATRGGIVYVDGLPSIGIAQGDYACVFLTAGRYSLHG